jgi:hypothetical protein
MDKATRYGSNFPVITMRLAPNFRTQRPAGDVSAMSILQSGILSHRLFMEPAGSSDEAQPDGVRTQFWK